MEISSRTAVLLNMFAFAGLLLSLSVRFGWI
ncbi:stress response membrane protein YncL [Cronobacter malonaticus]|uniref:Stress response membrane protein YncL n=1 Tax=Cronobacter malonaticus TaxID=413503 RepID=A0A423XRL6_9ENTR|nr:stress response membrane protein YncL [Cronobacter malonaticus]EGT4280845.1 stress response membrane protein YncL [Cronobacter malonaticus]EGT4287105.1 stress response membrane protein YncL [Cronobacter malonaticus]EGT4297250.1 stress response membrane protein YncL [Cronobacter malonaticus]EGT4313052.1 stress response membrane protein YncL [Cronobacter malonaticus]EGT4333003.1 stress response membrane protein YncL [Cronobacter malonaticus]